MRNNPRTFPAAEIAANDESAMLDVAAAFGRGAPLEVDLGCGDGSFLAQLALENPERNFLGVERMPGRIRAACRKIGDAQLQNARVLRAEILQALHTLLPPASAEVCHLLFSDPWPKRRHHARRVFSPEFLSGVARVLVPGGFLRVATDHAEYFAAMERVWSRAPDFRVAPAAPGAALRTTFENRFRAHGAAIHRVVLQRRGNDCEAERAR